MALELSDLSFPLSRSQADKLLSKDYSFRVLEDMTVRRSWKLRNRTVSVDFSPKEGDEALLIFIEYGRPVTTEEAGRDAEQLMRTECGKWTRLNAQRAARLGMDAAEGVKQDGGRYCFRELDDDGRVVRLAYYAGKPGEPRWELATDGRVGARTAMGSRSVGGNSEFLWQDEERRLGVKSSASSSASSSSSRSSLNSAAAAVVAGAPELPSAANSSQRVPREMIARPEDPVDVEALFREWWAKLTPTHFAAVGALLVMWVLWRMVVRAREAKRRAMVTQYIMNRGRIRTEDEED